MCLFHAQKPNVRVPTIRSEKLSEFLLDSALRPQQNLPHASRIELRNKNVVTVMLSPIFEATLEFGSPYPSFSIVMLWYIYIAGERAPTEGTTFSKGSFSYTRAYDGIRAP